VALLAAFKTIVRCASKWTGGFPRMIYYGYTFGSIYVFGLFSLDMMLDQFYSDRFDITNDPVVRQARVCMCSMDFMCISEKHIFINLVSKFQ
jgi:hypothetical protein